MVLYRAWGGNRWGSSFGDWATVAPLERWKGVLVQDGRVVGLVLNAAGLRGEIPPEIAGLTALESLDLGNNSLSGEIPKELGVITGLESLSLYNNQLTGGIPAELGNLSNLKALNLNDNMLSGDIPSTLGNLSALFILRLEGNELTGCVPANLREQVERRRSVGLPDLDYCQN